MSSKTSPSQQGPLFRIPPFYYIHVLDQNSTVTRLEIGSQIFLKQDNEVLIFGPEKMLTIPPRHYCVVENPVVKDNTGQVQYHGNGQVKLAHGDIDVRLETNYKDPFPLYPGEILRQVECDHSLIRSIDFFCWVRLACYTVAICSCECRITIESSI